MEGRSFTAKIASTYLRANRMTIEDAKIIQIKCITN